LIETEPSGQGGDVQWCVDAINPGRNLIVATGTGSGKTECYLLPVIDALLREADAGTLSRPGGVARESVGNL